MAYGHAEENSASTARQGFTIVELLIVVVVIAILAAITIVAYNGIQNRAKASAAQSSAKQAYTKIQTYAVQNADTYPATTTAAGLQSGGNATYQYSVNNTSTPKTFCITTTVQNVSYYASNTTTSPVAGACNGHGVNGVAAITNLASDPAATTFTSAGLGRWSADRYGGDGTYTLLTNVSDHPDGLQTALRFTVSTARGGHGFHFANNAQIPTPNNGSGYSALLPVTADVPLTISAWIRKSGASIPFVITARPATDSATWTSGSFVSSQFQSQPGAWVRVSLTFTPPAGTEKIAALISSQSTDAIGDTIDGTGLMITEGAALYSFAKGDFPGWAWNGDPNNSTSSGPPLP